MDGARAELYIDTGDKERNKRVYFKLYERKDEYNSKFGSEIEWQELPDKRASRICVNYSESGLIDGERWDDVIDFYTKSITKLKELFKAPLDFALKE